MPPTLINTEEIVSILRARHCINENDQIQLLPDDGRGRCGVTSSGIWFRIAQDLDALAHQANAFYKACPDIAAEPVFFLEENALQCFGCGHEISAEEPRQDQLTHAIPVLETAFAATSQPSTPAAAEAEIDAFLFQLSRVANLSLLDQELLTRYIGNELKARLVESQPTTRWSHGNLTAPAIRVGKTGRIRLLEPEFACRTHFFAEDFLRLGQCMESHYQHPPILRAYSWLREILIHPNSVLPNLARALKILDGSGKAVRQSVFAQAAAEITPAAPQATSSHVSAKLYASQTEIFSEDTAIVVEVERFGWQKAQFVLHSQAASLHLRLDPAAEPGLTEISHISVRSQTVELFSSDQPARVLSASGTCFAMKSDGPLLLLSYGDDPQVLLPRILLSNEPSELTVEVWMHWRSLPEAVKEYQPLLLGNGTSVL